MSRILLLISKRPEDQLFAAEVCLAAGLTLRQVSGCVEGAAVIDQEESPVVIVDVSSEAQYQEFETAIQDSVGLFSDKVNPNLIHFLSLDDLEKSQHLVQSPLFGNFILRNVWDPKEAGRQYGRIIKASLDENAFGLANLLRPGAKIQSIKFSSTAQKNNAVEAVKAYLLAAKFQSRMASIIGNAVDEILMNAMYDAPVDDLGKPLYNSTPRSTVFQLEGRSVVELEVGFDGKVVGLSVIDLYGSLDKVKMLSHISKVYIKDEYKVKTSTAGSGTGLMTVFRSGGSFLFSSESRVRTEVAVFFKRADNFREFKDQFRFISTQFYF